MNVKKQLFVASRYERVTVRRSTSSRRIDSFCKTCGNQVDWLTLAEVSALTGEATDEITRKIAGGEIDFQITDDNRFLICAESVFS